MRTIRDVIEQELKKPNPVFKTQKEVYNALGMSEQSYFQLLKRNAEKFDTKTTTLKRIADVLNINVEVFFINEEPKSEVSKSKYEDLSDYWSGLVKELSNEIGQLKMENWSLRKELGKFSPVLHPVAMYQ